MFRNRFQMVQPKAGNARRQRCGNAAKKSRTDRAGLSRRRWTRLDGHLADFERDAGAADRRRSKSGLHLEHLAERQPDFAVRSAAEIHAPLTLKDAITAKRSLAYHEFFLHQAAFAIKRLYQRHGSPAVPLRVDDAVDRRIRALLPFDMTPAQPCDRGHPQRPRRHKAHEPPPARRRGLRQNGGGALRNARRNATGICRKPLPQNSEPRTQIRGASGRPDGTHGNPRRAALHHALKTPGREEGQDRAADRLGHRARTPADHADIADGTIGLIVGTHALLSEEVQFKSLAMIVIDEQHKFGVEQRSHIRTKPAGAGIRRTCW